MKDADEPYRKLATRLTQLSPKEMYEIVTGRINKKDTENLIDEFGLLRDESVA